MGLEGQWASPVHPCTSLLSQPPASEEVRQGTTQGCSGRGLRPALRPARRAGVLPSEEMAQGAQGSHQRAQRGTWGCGPLSSGVREG